MRDLYAPLGLTPRASEEEIRAALARTDHRALRSAAVLLDPERKRIYDRAWLALRTIGVLRADMRLHDARRWRTDHADFRLPSDGQLPLLTQWRLLRRKAAEEAQEAEKSRLTRAGCLVSLAVCLALWGIGLLSGEEHRPVPALPQTSEASIAVPRPETGVAFRRGSALAPLTVVTAEGADYLVRLTSPEGTLILEAYIRGGEALETLVPLGDFELKYASGRIWQGMGALFGSHTAYAKADRRFSFKSERDGYTGYSVRLIRQRHGNLSSLLISAEEF